MADTDYTNYKHASPVGYQQHPVTVEIPLPAHSLPAATYTYKLMKLEKGAIVDQVRLNVVTSATGTGTVAARVLDTQGTAVVYIGATAKTLKSVNGTSINIDTATNGGDAVALPRKRVGANCDLTLEIVVGTGDATAAAVGSVIVTYFRPEMNR